MKSFYASLTLLFLTPLLFAGPVVNSASGSLTRGSTIVITGLGFGTKSPAAPILWADFEQGSTHPTTMGQRSTWDGNDNFSTSSVNQISGSVYNVVGTWDSGAAKRSFSFLLNKTTWTKVYMYDKRYFTYGPGANQKFWRLWPSSGTNDFLAVYSTNSGHNCGNEQEPSGSGVIGGFQGTDYTAGVWQTEEFHWSHSGEGTGLNTDGSPGASDGVWKYLRNGTTVQHRENVNNYFSNHRELRVADNFTDTAAAFPDGEKVYMDDIYVDDTYSRVMIGNAPTFLASTQRTPCIPTAWSDTSISCAASGSMTSGYVFVIDASDMASNGFQAGITITIGGSGRIGGSVGVGR